MEGTHDEGMHVVAWVTSVNPSVTHDFGHHDGVLMMVYSGSS
jgi:hypothetical protein